MSSTSTPGGYSPPEYDPQAGVAQLPGHTVPPQGYGDPGPNAAWGYPVQPPPRRLGALKITLLSVGVSILVAGSAAGFFVYEQAKDTGYKLVPPGSFSGLVRADRSNVVEMLQGQGDRLRKSGAVPVITAYAAGAGRAPFLLVIGGYGALPEAPSRQLDAGWKGVANGAREEDAVSQKTDEDPGPLGGAMQCAFVQTAGEYVPICFWADESTAVMVMDTAHTGSDANLGALAETTRQLRAQMEVKK